MKNALIILCIALACAFVNTGCGSSHGSSQAGGTSPVTSTGLSITTTSLPSGKVGNLYSFTIQATSGDGLIRTWSVVSGSLPPGIAMDAGSGILSGTPTTAGGYPVMIQVRNATSSASQSFTITIDP